MALDLFAIVSNGLFPEDRTEDADWFSYAITQGLLGTLPASSIEVVELTRSIVRDILRDILSNIMR